MWHESFRVQCVFYLVLFCYLQEKWFRMLILESEIHNTDNTLISHFSFIWSWNTLPIYTHIYNPQFVNRYMHTNTHTHTQHTCTHTYTHVVFKVPNHSLDKYFRVAWLERSPPLTRGSRDRVQPMPSCNCHVGASLFYFLSVLIAYTHRELAF